MDAAQSQQEELDSLQYIYEDMWTDTWKDEEGQTRVLHVPLPDEYGNAIFTCKLPAHYPLESVKPGDIRIEGVQSELESMLVDMLRVRGLIESEGVQYGRSGDPILFDVVSGVREALAWRFTDEMMEELEAEMEEGPAAEEQDATAGASDGSEGQSDPDWQRYESEKRRGLFARRRERRERPAASPEAPAAAEAKRPVLTGNAAWKARLQAGETVSFRGGGNSLAPLIKSGECCTYAPVFKHEDVRERDVVFCQIKGRFWGHMVKKKTLVHRGRDGEPDEYVFTISNIHGHENGDCTLDKVYGKVTAVSK